MDDDELAVMMAEFIHRCVYGFPTKMKGFEAHRIQPMLDRWKANLSDLMRKSHEIRTAEIIKAQREKAWAHVHHT